MCKSKNRYYGMYGNNALSVQTSYDNVLQKRDYFQGLRQKGFNSYLEVCNYAIKGYNSLQDPDDSETLFYPEDNKLKMNWVYYRNAICKENRGE